MGEASSGSKNLVLRTSGDFLSLWPYYLAPFGDDFLFFLGFWKANPRRCSPPKTGFLGGEKKVFEGFWCPSYELYE